MEQVLQGAEVVRGGEGLETGKMEKQAEDYEDFEADSRELPRPKGPRDLTHKASELYTCC